MHRIRDFDANSHVIFVFFRYQSRKDPDYVEYTQFCDEVESIFTFKELEKAPLQEVVPFKPPEEWKQNAFKDAEEQQTFENAMYKIAEKVRCLSPLLSIFFFLSLSLLRYDIPCFYFSRIICVTINLYVCAYSLQIPVKKCKNLVHVQISYRTSNFK